MVLDPFQRADRTAITAGADTRELVGLGDLIPANLPILPMAIGAALGFAWQRQPLAAVLGALAGYVIGPMLTVRAATPAQGPMAPGVAPASSGGLVNGVYTPGGTSAVMWT